MNYESLDVKNILDGKGFWKAMKPFLSDKSTIFSQICIENNKGIISDVFDLSCLKSLVPFSRMLLDHSVSSQMNII